MLCTGKMMGVISNYIYMWGLVSNFIKETQGLDMSQEYKLRSESLLSRNFSEQRKLRIHNGFSHLGHEIIVENFV